MAQGTAFVRATECIVCGGSLPPDSHHARKTCSPECAKKQTRRARAARRAAETPEAAEERRRRWREIKHAQYVPKPKREERKTEIVCEGCGLSVLVYTSAAKGRRFCSWECRTAQPLGDRASARVEWSCAECGRIEMKKKSRTHRKFCSTACGNANAKRTGRLQRPETWTVVPCSYCGQPIKTRGCFIKNGRGKFCDRECASKGRSLPPRVSKICTDIADLIAERHPWMRVEQEVRASRWLIDIALPDIGVAVEIDGVYWHSLPGIKEKDARKDARLAAIGWRVERFPVNRETALEVVELIEQRLSLDAT